jgi:hypothetical protein
MSSSSDIGIRANQLPVTVEIPRDETEFYDYLTLHIKRVANAVNTKTGGLYTEQEQYSFNQYFTVNNPNIFRNVYRYVYDMVALNAGPIAPGATFATPHNIPMPTPTSLLNGTHIYGSATNSDAAPNGPKRLPLPYASSTLTKNIEIYFDNVNVTIINGSTQTALTYCTIVLEYLKN